MYEHILDLIELCQNYIEIHQITCTGKGYRNEEYQL